VIARRSVWSNPEVQALLQSFVTVADEVGRLQRGDDAESEVFRGFCESGHYGGRTQPTNTRQGTYAVAPSGRFLASINSNDPQKMAAMLRTALQRYGELDAAARRLPQEQQQRLAAGRRFEDRCPQDGLVLAEYVRDLDRPAEAGAAAGDGAADWRTRAWNEDQVWFSAAEARAWVPATPTVGAVTELPERLAVRLVRLHLVDSVRGQTPSLPRDSVRTASFRSEVTAVDGDRVHLKIGGSTLAVQSGRWIVRDRGEPVDHERGVRTQIEGRAEFDTKANRFVLFELLCTGERWGATQYNGRADDQQKAPIGFAFVLAEPDHPRVAPAFWWEYDLH
jgi:hypothetical protein